jgi:hypothetical protein
LGDVVGQVEILGERMGELVNKEVTTGEEVE